MSSVEQFKENFMRIYERIVDKRGLPVVYGRIMASFFLEERELNQKELSDLTDYSISSISRAVDQMIKMGLLQKHKNPSRKFFLYQMKVNFIDLAVAGLQTWIRQAKESKDEISEFLGDINTNAFNIEEKSEATRIKNRIEDLKDEMELFIKLISKSVEDLKKKTW